jgi:GNAT superfamily N-acetyltransferase
MRSNPPLPAGYSPVPAGKLVNAVTCLEMLAPPVRSGGSGSGQQLSIERWHAPATDAYLALFRAIGADWLWASRLAMSEAGLREVLDDPLVEVFCLSDGLDRLGLLELDFRTFGECELAYFGIVGSAIGKGVGRGLMEFALAHVWSRPIRRFWVHTCSFDHPSALAFYQRAGFRPYAMMAEVLDDPRLTGVLPRTAAPHVPLIDALDRPSPP